MELENGLKEGDKKTKDVNPCMGHVYARAIRKKSFIVMQITRLD